MTSFILKRDLFIACSETPCVHVFQCGASVGWRNFKRKRENGNLA